ncbi:MAG: Ktr system potassium transporter B [Pseudomonadales bacterium]|nr:Ktr system potassium transporter B [Pseudomonadales bacterium]
MSKSQRRHQYSQYVQTVNRRNSRLNRPASLILVCYALILLPSTLFLMTEIASVTGLGWIDALFTATSALTVTGLGVVDTGSHFSALGHVWLLLLMQLGGLGQMTLGVIILLALRQRISLKEQAIVREELNQDVSSNIFQLVRAIVLFAIIVESIGVLILSLSWVPEMGWWKGIYYAVFHAVSAFNNAGFSLFNSSLTGYASEPSVLISLSALFIIGGLGFTVILDLLRYPKQARLSLHSKLTLLVSVALLLIGSVLIYLLERDNPLTLGHLDASTQYLGAFFQSATARTAGFNSINIIDMSHAGLLVMMTLMFIGAGSTSTGGGIKVSTFAVALIATRSFLQGHSQFTAFKRNIAPMIALKALAIIVVSFFILISATFMLMVTENARFDVVLFEAISAFSTVGLTAGLTAELSPAGKLIMTGLMIIGRIGPITLAYFATLPKQVCVSYADEDVITG